MIKSVKQKIGYRIKLARMLKNLSREELAERLQVSTNYIYKIEAGIGGFSLETIEKIAVAIGVDIAYFYDWEEQEIVNRVKDVQSEYGKSLEERIMALVKETIQQYCAVPAQPLPAGQSLPAVMKIAELVKQLPAELQRQLINELLTERFRN